MHRVTRQLCQVNTDLEKNRHDHIAYCLNNQYDALGKNVPVDSEFLFTDDLPKKKMNVTANKKLFSTSKASFQSDKPYFKNSKNFKTLPIPSKTWELQPKWVTKQNRSIPKTMQQQPQQQIFQTKEILKLIGRPKFYYNILTELQKNVENFKVGNLRYFSKNWYHYTKDKYILDIVTNGLKLDLKQLLTQNSRSSYSLTIKEKEIILLEIKKILKKSVIVFSTPDEGEFISGIFSKDKKDDNKKMILNLKK